MGWLTRIQDSLLSKIKKKIPKKDLESVEKTREEKKIKIKEIVKKETAKVEEIKQEIHKEEQKTNELVKNPDTKKRTFFGLLKRTSKEEQKIEKDPEKNKNWFQKLETGLFKSSEIISQGVKKIFDGSLCSQSKALEAICFNMIPE